MQLEAVLARATGQPPSALRLRPSLDHQSNRLYEAWAGDRRLIVKEFLKPDELHDAPLREFRALELLAPLDIAPRPIHFQPAAPPLGPLVIYEYVEGEMWDRRPPTPGGLAALANVWLKMHAAAPPGELWPSRGHGRLFGGVVEALRARLEGYAAWVEAGFPPGRRAAELCLGLLRPFSAVAAQVAGLPAQLAFCRADPRFANVIACADGRLRLVDWEDSGLRDPALDLADLLSHPNQEDLLAPAEWEAFLAPYFAAREPVDPGLRRRMRLYLRLFPVFYLSTLLGHGVERARAGTLAGWQANEMPPNRRLRRYLARALAWPEQDFTAELERLEEVRFFPAG
ncbi:MAG: aminoglycoside phosphotransferase family protein [Chloroflexi bacterium]|nr:aminoglycoside phosphotransferase family protein [Chloroflexota bacterium]